MKKRLPKKHHQGEFTEWGHQFVILRNRQDGFDIDLWSDSWESLEMKLEFPVDS
jgi:hypothetical protein